MKFIMKDSEMRINSKIKRIQTDNEIYDINNW